MRGKFVSKCATWRLNYLIAMLAIINCRMPGYRDDLRGVGPSYCYAASVLFINIHAFAVHDCGLGYAH